MTEQGYNVPPGCVCVTTYGPVESTTASSLMEMRGRAERMGLTNIQWPFVAGHLVDKARNEGASAMLKSGGQWILYIDADMSFDPDILDIMLRTAFGDPATKDFDIVGGWAQLRGAPYIATIDKGSGTWELMDARIGPIEVIRTGGACLLVKRHVFERMEYPWFGVRPAGRPLDYLAEVDNYLRIKYDGKNPFAGKEWDAALRCAQQDAASQRNTAAQNGNPPGWQFGSVGEDSNFTDRAKALGFRILVQTDAVTHHLERRPITPEMHNDEIKKVYRNQAYLCGVMD